MTVAEPLLSLGEVSVRMGGRLLIEALGLEARAGQCWALLGANGRGKSSLLHVIAGLRAPESGRVRYRGRDVSRIPPRELGRLRALVEQVQHDAFAQTVREHLALARSPFVGGWDLGAGDTPEVERALDVLGLRALAESDVRRLSGGERQRVAVAAALAQDTPVMLLDEPLAHLDPVRRDQVARLLTSQRDRLVVMALHEPELALEVCTHALLLTDTGWHAGPVDDLLESGRLAALYGGDPWVATLPAPGPGARPLRVIRWGRGRTPMT